MGSSSALASTIVKNWREHPPSSYSLKVHNFSQLEKSTTVSDDKYQSRPFSSGGYNWRLIVYPKGNEKDDGSGFISMYVEIDSKITTEVFAELRFFVYNKKENKYFTIQDLEVRRFNALKTVWGLQQFLPLDTFNDLKNGYIFEGGHCEFGVDVIVASPLTNWEILSFDEKLSKPNDTLKEDEKIFVQANLRVLDPLGSNHIQLQMNVWFEVQNASWGWNKFMSLAELRKTYLDNKEHAVNVEIEFKVVSATNYSPIMKLTFVVCGTQKLHKYNIPIYIPQLFNYFEQHVPLTINLAWNGVTSLIVSPTRIVG
ncbi:hypothetical protein HID58_027479 [Brassica napus]|uniref:MATH domain-containing protein n=1 Tax=Brassica napus TaxID=3708 RepID=A0ABQ8CS01_BRANA|nr:hypothetical protein HID58_027479 [Brassica napus]